ncbi:hypothetical protein KPH14_007016 [Odynerus spinipes]|uniref:Uncharacterized protein n=1 Tax=Odynerus spinipes TaxID=1348599 RepID=A0AAD9VSP5_9HYME|nr:hypothetical protein KPH14_007016 [Odynerus spinipes]
MKRRSPGQGSRWSSDRDSSAGKFYGTGHAEGSSFPHRTEEGELIDHERRDESNVIDQCSNFDDATSRTIENAAEENRTSVLRERKMEST